MVQLAGGVGNILHHHMDTFDEGVDVLGYSTNLIFSLNLDAAGQVTVATGEVGNGLPQGFQRSQ